MKVVGNQHVQHLPSVKYSNDYNRHNKSHAMKPLQRQSPFKPSVKIYNRKNKGTICLKGKSNCSCGTK